MLLGARQFFEKRGAPTPIDMTDMTVLHVTATSSYLTYAIRQGVLANDSSSVRVYWDALGDISVYTDYNASFDNISHTYSTPGDYVVAISDDLKQISLSGGSSSSASKIANSNMLTSATMGAKVTTFPSPGGGDTEALYQANKLTYLDLRNVANAVRPLWSVGTRDGILIAPNVTRINSYGLQNAIGWKVYCDNLTHLNETATNGMVGGPGVEFYFQTRTTSYILSLSGVLRSGLRGKEYQKFIGTDGYVHWDGSAWAAVAN